MRTITLLLALTALLGAAHPAAADGKAALLEAKAHFDRGETHYRIAEFEKALAEYMAALKLARRPSIIFNIAQCHRQLRNHAKALFYYRLYLSDWARQNKKGASPPHHAEVKEHIGRAAELLKKEKERKERAKASQAASAPATPAAPAPAKPAPEPEPPRRSRTWLIVGLTGAGVALAGGVAGIALHVKASGEFETNEDGTANSSFTGPRNAAYVMYAIGGAALVASAASLGYYLLGNKEGSSPASDVEPDADVSFVPLDGGAYVGATLRF